MKSSTRRYASELRAQSAEDTRKRILDAATALFSRKGIDKVTVADIGARAGVAASTVYGLYKSKDGLLRAIMQRSLFGPSFQAARELLNGVTDPVQLIALTSHVSRAIYASESENLGLLSSASGFSPALRKLEQEFERIRYDMQEERLRALFKAGKARRGLTLDEARRVLWTFTSRDIYRMLVQEGGWSPDRYQEWLSRTLLEALVAKAPTRN